MPTIIEFFNVVEALCLPWEVYDNFGVELCASYHDDACVDAFLDEYGQREPYDFRFIEGYAIAYSKEG